MGFQARSERIEWVTRGYVPRHPQWQYQIAARHCEGQDIYLSPKSHNFDKD
jgi:hypothetical protein